MIPYGHQTIDDDDIQAVLSVLKSEWLTQGPKVEEFEKALADYCGTNYAVVVSNGTAALQAAYHAVGLKPGDEIISSPNTFPATTNAALWFGAKPIFCDIDSRTGNIDANLIEQNITSQTRAIVPVDFTGRPVDLDKIRAVALRHKLVIIEDACQALGASYYGQKVGCISDLTTFSFHPVKTITTGEGGAVLTNNRQYYEKMKSFVTHGVKKNNFINVSPGDWYFEMQDLGQNYRLTDLQCALGISQLKKVDDFVSKRRKIVEKYNQAFAACKNVQTPLLDDSDTKSAWHLYVVQLQNELSTKKPEIFERLRKKGIGVQVHHIPVYTHPYYQGLNYKKGLCPKAEDFYNSAISLPLFPDLSGNDQNLIIEKFLEIIKSF